MASDIFSDLSSGTKCAIEHILGSLLDQAASHESTDDGWIDEEFELLAEGNEVEYLQEYSGKA